MTKQGPEEEEEIDNGMHKEVNESIKTDRSEHEEEKKSRKFVNCMCTMYSVYTTFSGHSPMFYFISSSVPLYMCALVLSCIFITKLCTFL